MTVARRCLSFLLTGALALPAQRPPLETLAQSRLATLDGELRVPELDSAVEVRRDRWGVPHIYARTTHDLFFAQGYVAAQDRLFQMDVWRRAGEGRLAEVFGPQFVARDRLARQLRWRGDTVAEWTSYAPDARALVTAFVAGVNAQIAAVRERPPVEFTMLGYLPEPWTPEVPLQRMAALGMTGNALEELARARVVAAIGPERARAVMPTDPPRAYDPARGLDLTGLDPTLTPNLSALYAQLRLPRVEGSNNWVVSGAKSASGKPILANDPHRAIQNPALRYLTHLVGPGWNVIGAGEPGVPGVAAGHNERVAFGFTIVGMDQQDVYVETVRPCAQVARTVRAERCYLNHGTWKPVQALADTIRVKGEPPRAVMLEFTEHGPLIADDTLRRRAIAIRFVGSEPGTAGYMASLSINRAHDWKSFRAAAARWKLPTENLIYADVDGNIGWIAAGLMPLRSWSGLLPVPGDGRFEWTGFLSPDSLPSSYNPAAGFIATANHNILPPGYRHALSYEWAAPFRVDRIKEVLRARDGWTVADFQALQHDAVALPARALVPLLIDAAARRGLAERADVRLLGAWDYTMRRESGAALLYAAFERAIVARVIRPRIPAEVAEYVSVTDGDGLERTIAFLREPDAVFGADPTAGRDAALIAALDDATAQVSREFGADPTAWRWGAAHVARFPHPVASVFDLPSVSRGGYGSTVYATGGSGWSQSSGASFREIIDLADWDRSVATSTPGQSGQPGSPHYGDLLQLWAKDEYFPLVYSRAAVERETLHTLILVPALR
ncbi:MAG: penicillin acylase family protein [Gemmatimonadaceae bacterium]|nr:penicillin acylase family protein [Gemmatimonadaceae bacterium]